MFLTYNAPTSDLSNFQGFFECESGVRIGRPESIEQAKLMVQIFEKVKASGML